MSAERKVLLLVDSFRVGGAETQLVQLARLLRERGRYRVRLACLDKSGKLLAEAEQLDVGDIPEFPLRRFYDRNFLAQLRRFAAFLRRDGVDVVHTEGFYTNIFGMFGAALARTPARIAFRGEVGGIRTRAQLLIEREGAYRLAHAVHANSEAVRRQLVGEGVPDGKIITVYNGLDLARVTPGADFRREEALARLGLPAREGARFVTIVANMRHEVKDHPTFLRAARRVRAAVPEACFVLAGEGELTDELRALAAQLGVADSTFFIGRCENVAELLAASDVCALSSRAEGFSNSILEYMAASRPVVATSVGGVPEAVVDGETGRLVAPGDDEGMARHISALLRDPAGARAMGERGRRRVEEKFSDAAQLENTQAMYDRVLARRESPVALALRGASGGRA